GQVGHDADALGKSCAIIDASASGVRAPKLNSSPSSIVITRRLRPAGGCATPGIWTRPSTPPTDSNPVVVMRITSGAALTIASLVIGVNESERPIAEPASTPPAAAIIESAPDPGPPMR